MVLVTFLLFSLNLHAQEPVTKIDSLFLPTGFEAEGITKNVVFSFNLIHPVTVELTSDARYCNPSKPKICGPVTLPRKTKFLGRVLTVKSANRINIGFDRIVLPDGRELEISAVALAPDGSLGLPGKVKKERGSKIAAAALRGAITGAAGAATGGGNPVAESAAEEMAEASSLEIELMRETVDSSIKVPAYTHCRVRLLNRFEFPNSAEKQKSKSTEKNKNESNP